jgi:hypothetical protein
MLYSVWVMEGIVEREMIPPLGLGQKSFREEVAIQCLKTRHGCVGIPELVIGAEGLFLCKGTDEMRKRIRCHPISRGLGIMLRARSDLRN